MNHPHICIHSVQLLHLTNDAELLWYGQKSFFCTFTRTAGVVQYCVLIIDLIYMMGFVDLSETKGKRKFTKGKNKCLQLDSNKQFPIGRPML